MSHNNHHPSFPLDRPYSKIFLHINFIIFSNGSCFLLGQPRFSRRRAFRHLVYSDVAQFAVRQEEVSNAASANEIVEIGITAFISIEPSHFGAASVVADELGLEGIEDVVGDGVVDGALVVGRNMECGDHGAYRASCATSVSGWLWLTPVSCGGPEKHGRAYAWARVCFASLRYPRYERPRASLCGRSRSGPAARWRYCTPPPSSKMVTGSLHVLVRSAVYCLLVCAACFTCIEAFAPRLSLSPRRSAAMALHVAAEKQLAKESVVSNVVATSALAVALTVGIVASPAFADEYGRETEAPTLFTGENVMVGWLSFGSLHWYPE